MSTEAGHSQMSLSVPSRTTTRLAVHNITTASLVGTLTEKLPSASVAEAVTEMMSGTVDNHAWYVASD